MKKILGIQKENVIRCYFEAYGLQRLSYKLTPEQVTMVPERLIDILCRHYRSSSN